MSMSFPFKTAAAGRPTMPGMKTNTSPRCPFQASGTPTLPQTGQPGAWPPGPPSGLTGWGLLRRMSGDLLGTLSEWQATYGDVVHLRIWPEHQVVLTDPQLVRELLTRHHDALIRWERGIQVFSRMHGRSVFIAEGQEWRTKRRALQPSFSARNVQALVPTIAAATAEALARWPADEADWPIESAFTSLAMDVILRTMFSGEIGEDARRAEKAVHDLIVEANAELYWPASGPDWLPWKRAKRQGLELLHALIDRHIDARLNLSLEAWPEDMLTRVLALHRQDAAAWPLAAVRDECMTAFLAGHETTAASLTWWAWCMAANPAAQDRARREVRDKLGGHAPAPDDLDSLAYVVQTLHESLRLYPTAPVLLSRRCIRPISLGAWQFPARTMFLVPLRLMHHDPRWFPEPQAFRPERFADGGADAPRGAFMPFGDGPRICLGQHLALSEMTIIAAMLLQRFVLGMPESAAPPRPVLRVSLRPEQPLRLRLESCGAR